MSEQTQTTKTRTTQTQGHRRPVVVVTGATGGMGEAIVRDLAVDHEVVAVGRRADALAGLADELGVRTWQLDIGALARGEQPDAGRQAAALGPVYALVHVAAVGDHHRLEDADLARWHEQFDTNVIGPAELTRLLIGPLRASHGTIVFVGSGASRNPVPGSVVYPASKHALLALAEVLRIDEAPHRVRITSLEPGPTNTAMFSGSVPREALIQPESVARSVRFVVDAPDDVDLTVLALRPRVELGQLGQVIA